MGADGEERIRVQRENQDDGTQIDDNLIEREGGPPYTGSAHAGQYTNFDWPHPSFRRLYHIETTTEGGLCKMFRD